MGSTTATKRCRLEHAGLSAPAAKRVKILGVFTPRKSFTQPISKPYYNNVFDVDNNVFSPRKSFIKVASTRKHYKNVFDVEQKAFSSRKSFVHLTTKRTLRKNVFNSSKKGYVKVGNTNKIKISNMSTNKNRVKSGFKNINGKRKITDYFSVRKPPNETNTDQSRLNSPNPIPTSKAIETPVNNRTNDPEVICKLCCGEFGNNFDLESHARLCLINIFLGPKITLK